MSDVKKIVDQSVSPQEQEELIEQLLEQKFDSELKSKWVSKLEKEYETPKKIHINNPKPASNKLLYLITASVIAASIVILLMVLKPFSTKLSADAMAHQYIASTEMYDIRASKGLITDENSRIQAITAFNKKAYQETLQAYQNITELKTQDIYYSGLSHIKLNQFNEASIDLEKALEASPSDQLQQEINWYLSLSYVLSFNEKAVQQLAKIKEADWKHSEAQALLKALQ